MLRRRKSPAIFLAMRHFYALNRQPHEAPEGVDKVWLDGPTTERQERDDMMDQLRGGDVVVVLATTDLGHGREIRSMQDAIEAKGATLEVDESWKPTPAPRGRPRTFDPDPTQDRKIKALYRGYQKLSYVLDRASEIMGWEVQRHHLRRRYGARWKKPE